MPNTVISIEHVSKSYQLGVIGTGTFYGDLKRWWARQRGRPDPYRKIGETNHGNRQGETLWALKDINFQIQQGEALGIIGRNGAGKSTLLKILSRVTVPTSGEVKVRGRIASLLEVGTGFHSELTGRENIYLNGAIMGMNKAEITRKFDEIVDFSGVEQFIDTPVKRYSSGMYVRLAFAVAAHLDPEILIVDEVLAVGDVEFQKKCLGKMGAVAHEGRTVLFVSHNLGAIQQLCNQAAVLNGGQISMIGSVNKAIEEYLSSSNTASALYTPQKSQGYTDLIIEKAVLKNSQGQATINFTPNEDICVEIYFNALKKLARPNFWILVESGFGGLFGANMLFDGACPNYIEGRGIIACTFSGLQLIPRIYTITIGIRHQNGMNNYIPATQVGSFSVLGSASDLNMVGEMAHNFFEDFYPLLVPYAWKLPDGKMVPVNGFQIPKENTD